MLRKNQMKRATRQSLVHQLFLHSLFAYALFAACYFGSMEFRQALAQSATKADLQAQVKNMAPMPASVPGDRNRDGRLLDDGQRFLRAIERFLREIARNKLAMLLVPDTATRSHCCTAVRQ